MSMRLMVQAMNCNVGNPARKLVLLKLADNANDDGVCFPSYQYIADKCEMSKRSAINHIEELIKMGLISKQERKNKDGSASNLYFLHLEQAGEKSALGGEKSALGGEKSALGGSEKSAPITSHSFNQSINHNNPLPLNGESANADVDGEEDSETESPIGEKNKPVDYSGIAQAYNDTVEQSGVNMPRIADPNNLSDKRKNAVKKLSKIFVKRFGDGSASAIGEYFMDFVKSARPFHFGENDRGWKADFEFVLRESTLDKVLEGNL